MIYFQNFEGTNMIKLINQQMDDLNSDEER